MTSMIKAATRILGATLAAGTLALTAHAARAQQLDETERNRPLVIKGMQAWADGTGSPYDLLAENARWTIAGTSLAAKTYPSKEAFMSEVIRPFNARMGERLVPPVHRAYAEDDTVIVHFDARGMARDGKSYANSYAWILRMEGRQIVEAYAFFDSKTFDDLWTRVAPAERR